MSSTVQQGSLLKAELDISTKLSNLEERASNLEVEFSNIMMAARDLANAVKRYVDKTETESRSWDILESIIEGDNKVRDILDHVKVFFNFLLAKMASKHAEITDIKMLWHLIDKEGVKQVFCDAIKSFGFKESEADDIQLLLAVMYKLQVDLERDTEVKDKTTATSDDVVGKKRRGEDFSAYGNQDISNGKIDQLGCSGNSCISEISRMVGSSNSSGEQNSDVDYTSIPVDLSDKASSAVLSWNVEDSLKNVTRRMVAIVIYTLNVGRENKDQSIIAENKGQSVTE
ncbi:uncharacterized protein LOC123548713 [Mercenaria mercenaria]|uniref:uncharacterized protein LOC123548713 n=1 Tax=Mercenaria mercenaria TaxID=6596 RepID=UPI00234EC1ED|nr:uncharacterized protein LOC123548713 [Mercenaria mercenaria]